MKPNNSTEHQAAYPMFFIVGKGRSGTTLLQTMLDAHPSLLIPLESRIIIHLYSKYARVKKWDQKRLNSFYNDLFTDVKFDLLWNVDKEQLKARILSSPEDISFAELCQKAYLSYQSFFERGDLGWIGDKNPIYTIFIPELIRLYPHAKFIHLVRDYRDNILSHIKVFPIKDKAFLARKWVKYNEVVETYKAKFPKQFHTLRYEDLTENPEKEIRDICKFLEVDFHPDMLSFHQATNKAYNEYSDYIDKYHKNILNPVNKNSLGKWKKELKEADVRIADYVAGDYATQYGYEKAFDEVSMGMRWAHGLTFFKYYLWLGIMKGYYHTPLFVRTAYSNLFKAMFGKGYKKKPV